MLKGFLGAAVFVAILGVGYSLFALYVDHLRTTQLWDWANSTQAMLVQKGLVQAPPTPAPSPVAAPSPSPSK